MFENKKKTKKEMEETNEKNTKNTVRRGSYNEMIMSSLTDSQRKQVENLVYAASNAEKIDEHGSWDFGIENIGNRKRGGWHSLNWDLYGIGRDYFSKRILIVVQVRQAIKQKKSYWTEVKKSYFLIGRNEDNTVFAHSISGHTVQAAAGAGKDVVRAVQNWIFGADYTRIIRQGDVCLIPLKSKAVLAGVETITKEFTMQDSHLLKADEVKMNAGNNIYALNPNLYHLPKTHPDFENLVGWFKVVVGRRSDFYEFAAPTID